MRLWPLKHTTASSAACSVWPGACRIPILPLQVHPLPMMLFTATSACLAEVAASVRKLCSKVLPLHASQSSALLCCQSHACAASDHFMHASCQCMPQPGCYTVWILWGADLFSFHMHTWDTGTFLTAPSSTGQQLIWDVCLQWLSACTLLYLLWPTPRWNALLHPLCTRTLCST